MTEPSAASGSLDQWRDVLRKSGLKCTRSRLAVLQVLSTANSPLSHREICLSVVAHCTEPPTVFRNLVDLCEVNLVRRLDIGDHIWRFELNSSSNASHAHLVCIACGTINCLFDLTVANAAKRLCDFENWHLLNEVTLHGYCPRCGPPAQV